MTELIKACARNAVSERVSLSLGEIQKATNQLAENFISSYENFNLISHYQPIYSIDHQKIIGYEALIRVKNEFDENISPDELFDTPFDEKSSIYLDRLCRYTHVANYQRLLCEEKWLFINVSSLACEKSRNYGKFFAELLAYFNVPAEKVVVEIIEDHSTDSKKLQETCNYYKSIGCLIAIDDFGAGHSNFERIWNLQPDIVKLDRSILVRANKSSHTQTMLASMVQLLHQSGCLVVIEGVETEQQAIIAIESNADFVQGFYFSRPQPVIFKHSNQKPLFDHLITQNIALKEINLHQELSWSATYSLPFLQTIKAIKSGSSLTEAIEPLTNCKKLIRCFLLNHQGKQLQNTYVFEQDKLSPREQFFQLQLNESANWYRKHYVRNALKQHNSPYISSPYQSISGEGLCITISMSFDTDAGQRILCIDISAETI